MKLIDLSIKKILIPVMFLFCIIASGCSDSDEPIRQQEDILGFWKQTDADHYLAFYDNNNLLFNLRILTQDDETIGDWSRDTYFYEPGYNLAIFIDSDYHLRVYQILQLTDKILQWCWVEDLKLTVSDTASVGDLIGQIIKDADEGFDINPEYIESYVNIPENEFLNLLETLNIMQTW